MEILEFVKGDDVDPIYARRAHTTSLSDDGGEKPLHMRYSSRHFEESKYYALAIR